MNKLEDNKKIGLCCLGQEKKGININVGKQMIRLNKFLLSAILIMLLL